MSTVKNIILVHGAWADGSCWWKVIPKLASAGLCVTAVQLPLSSLASDAAAVKRAIALMDGPVLLVGHSYGGAVITEAGNEPSVAGLVYVAAFVPDAGESLGSLLGSVPPAPLAVEVKPDAEGYFKLTPKGIADDFAQDLSDVEKKLLLATQGPLFGAIFATPLTTAAWRTKSSWYMLATQDRAIPPGLQARMAAKIKAKTISVESSHVPMLSQPDMVVAHIIGAATAM